MLHSGDATRNDLLTNIATAHGVTVKIVDLGRSQTQDLWRFLSSEEDSIATNGACVGRRLILLAVMQRRSISVHREHVLVSRQWRCQPLLWLYTKSRAVDDPELLELEEL